MRKRGKILPYKKRKLRKFTLVRPYMGLSGKTNGGSGLLYGKFLGYDTELSFPNLQQRDAVYNSFTGKTGIRSHVHLAWSAEACRIHYAFKFISQCNGDGQQALALPGHIC